MAAILSVERDLSTIIQGPKGKPLRPQPQRVLKIVQSPFAASVSATQSECKTLGESIVKWNSVFDKDARESAFMDVFSRPSNMSFALFRFLHYADVWKDALPLLCALSTLLYRFSKNSKHEVPPFIGTMIQHAQPCHPCD